MISLASVLICLGLLLEVRATKLDPRFRPRVGGGFNTKFRSDYEVLRAGRRANYTIIGDMIFPPWDKRSSWTAAGTWPDHTIPIVISDNVTQDLTDEIYRAINHYHQYTCVVFRWAQPDEDNYWVRFLMDPDLVDHPESSLLCSAAIGFQNRKDQEVKLGRRCNFGSLVHELEHTLGFAHEHARFDRDDYLYIYPENMDPNAVSQYEREDEVCKKYGFPCSFDTHGVPFNYDSIMNYCTRCGSKNGYPVMASRENTNSIGAIDGSKLGQSVGFSEGDWLAVNRKHGCDPEAYPKPPRIPDNPMMNGPHTGYKPKPGCKKRYPKVPK